MESGKSSGSEQGTEAARRVRKGPGGVSWHAPGPDSPPPSQATQRLLLPVDGSELAERVLNLARRLLKPHSGQGLATLLEVLPDPGNSGRKITLLAEGRKRLAAKAEALSAPGFALNSLVACGDPAEEILTSARITGARLIVMATHGHGGLQRVVRGSVAERVLRSSETPLLLCNPHELGGTPEAPFLRLLVPLDGSRQSASILPLVEELALTHGAEVVLLSVDPQPLEEGSERCAEVTTFLNLAATHLRERGVKEISLRVADGEPASRILQAVEETRADLVAMATHGRSGFSRLRFGSVAEEVLRKCVRPILLVRDPATC